MRLISNSGRLRWDTICQRRLGWRWRRAAGDLPGGDGSLQMNVQELQTVVTHNLAVKIFVLNNGGYLSIRQTQNGFFQGG